LTTLINLLNTHKAGGIEKLSGKNGEWLIDLGASHHMTGVIKLLSEVRNIMLCPVGLPDGKQTNVVKEGIMHLGENIYLRNVLYVPNMNCTLIYVAKLMRDLSCTVTFTNKLCVMHDQALRTLIGLGEECDGVFLFQTTIPVHANKAKTMNVSKLWHERLGHPSKRILTYLPEANGGDPIDFCDICYKAKQTRDMFQESQNKAYKSFSLIHCDLWGPYKVPASCGASYFLTIFNDFSRVVWVYLLLEKREVAQTVKKFRAMIERQFEKQVKVI